MAILATAKVAFNNALNKDVKKHIFKLPSVGIGIQMLPKQIT